MRSAEVETACEQGKRERCRKKGDETCVPGNDGYSKAPHFGETQKSTGEPRNSPRRKIMELESTQLNKDKAVGNGEKPVCSRGKKKNATMYSWKGLKGQQKKKGGLCASVAPKGKGQKKKKPRTKDVRVKGKRTEEKRMYEGPKVERGLPFKGRSETEL